MNVSCRVRYALLRAVAGELAADDLLRVDRQQGAEDLVLLLADGPGPKAVGGSIATNAITGRGG